MIAGDGCLMEGLNHEAIGLAGHLGLGRMIVLWDDNNITIDGGTELSTSENVMARYEAAGWHVDRCDGHDFEDIDRALAEAVAENRPSLVACKTLIGKGAPNKQGTSSTHGSPLGADEVSHAREFLNWQHPPFEIPADILSDWTLFQAAAVLLASLGKIDWIMMSTEKTDSLRRLQKLDQGVQMPSKTTFVI